MEIVADLKLLALLDKSGGLEGISDLFGNPVFVVSRKSFKQISMEGISASLNERQIISKTPTKKERRLISRLKLNAYGISKSEIEEIAFAKSQNLMCLIHEDAARKACLDLGVKFLSLPAILKALWAKKIKTKKEVEGILENMEIQAGIKFINREQILGNNTQN